MCMTRYTLAQKIIRFNPFRDITVYKVMRRRDADSNEVYSAHRDFKTILGDVQYSRIDTDFDGNITVGLHSFPNIKDAKRELAALRVKEHQYTTLNADREPSQYGLYKCIIPKGSKYYKGYWTFHMPTYRIDNIVSTSLIIQEQIMDEDEIQFRADEKYKIDMYMARYEEFTQARKAFPAEWESLSKYVDYLNGKTTKLPLIVKLHRAAKDEAAINAMVTTPAVPLTAADQSMSPSVTIMVS